MTKITICDLNPVGSDLFMDSDTFLKELNDNEFSEIAGGVMSQFAIAFITYTPSLLA